MMFSVFFLRHEVDITPYYYFHLISLPPPMAARYTPFLLTFFADFRRRRVTRCRLVLRYRRHFRCRHFFAFSLRSFFFAFKHAISRRLLLRRHVFHMLMPLMRRC